MNITQFLFLENGQPVSKLKNTATTQLRNLKKEGKKTKLSEILDSLSQENNGKNYKSSIKEAKITSPYLSEDNTFYIPFYNNENKILMKLETLENKDDYAAFNKTSISFLDNNSVFSLYDILFFPKLKNIEKIENGWRLHLYITEQAKSLNGFNEDDDAWFDIVKCEDGIDIRYYQTEYCALQKGYNVNLIESTFVIFKDISLQEKKSLSIECYNEEINSNVISEIGNVLGFELFTFSGRAPSGMGKNLTITHNQISAIDVIKIEAYLKSKNFSYVGYYGEENKLFCNVNNDTSDWYYLTGQQSDAPNEYVAF